MQQTQQMKNESDSCKRLQRSDCEGHLPSSRSDSGFVDRTFRKPDFVLKQREVVVEEGRSAVFLCRPIGNPPPTVRWEKQGKTISADNRHWVG